MPKRINTENDLPKPQHTAANEAGIPTPDERRELRREFMRKHKGAYEALAR